VLHCKTKEKLSFSWTAIFSGKQVGRKVYCCEGQTCQFETWYRHRFFFIFARVVFAHILVLTVQLKFSTIGFETYLCCVGKSRSTKEAGIFISPCCLLFAVHWHPDLKGPMFEYGLGQAILFTKVTIFRSFDFC
jgi:hypothetical protein